MDIIGMLDKAINTLEAGPTDLESLTPGQVKQFAYASFIVGKAESIKKNMGKYANAHAVKAQANLDYQTAPDAMTKAQAFQAFNGARRSLSAVKRLEAVAIKLA